MKFRNRDAIALGIFAALLVALVVAGVNLYNRQKNIDSAVAKINAGHVTVETSEVTQAALEGFWKSEGDVKMTATVTQSTILISWNDGEVISLYWKGSFFVPARLVNGTKITSQGDTDQMSESLMASQDATKEFTFEKNKIGFQLTMLGVTQTVRLVRA